MKLLFSYTYSSFERIVIIIACLFSHYIYANIIALWRPNSFVVCLCSSHLLNWEFDQNFTYNHIKRKGIIQKITRPPIFYTSGTYMTTHLQRFLSLSRFPRFCRCLLEAGVRSWERFPCDKTFDELQYFLGKFLQIRIYREEVDIWKEAHSSERHQNNWLTQERGKPYSILGCLYL